VISGLFEFFYKRPFLGGRRFVQTLTALQKRLDLLFVAELVIARLNKCVAASGDARVSDDRSRKIAISCKTYLIKKECYKKHDSQHVISLS